jgi:hypothetical protein
VDDLDETFVHPGEWASFDLSIPDPRVIVANLILKHKNDGVGCQDRRCRPHRVEADSPDQMLCDWCGRGFYRFSSFTKHRKKCKLRGKARRVPQVVRG